MQMDDALPCLYAEYIVECIAKGVSPLSADEFRTLILSILESGDG